MSKTHKPRTSCRAPHVSRALREDAHYKSESYSTAVRGWRNTTTGYRVHEPPASEGKYVLVEHVMSHDEARQMTSGQKDTERRRCLDHYAETLTAAGWVVKVEGEGYYTRLRVEVPQS